MSFISALKGLKNVLALINHRKLNFFEFLTTNKPNNNELNYWN
jgi:hypothetical protein